MGIKNNPLSRRDDIVVQELGGEVLIYDLRSNKAFCLNETSAFIWQACDGSKDVPQLSEVVGKHLNSDVNEDLVWLALDQLKKEKLIDNVPDSKGYFGGMSRREVIKKVGMGTMVALPVVAALVAPSAANAASLLGPGSSSGSATLGGTCGGATTSQKNTACNSQTGAACSSGMATWDGSTCSSAGPNIIVSCNCT